MVDMGKPERDESGLGTRYMDVLDESRTVLEVVSAAHLQQVGTRPPIRSYLGQLWQRRHFLWAEARAKVTSGTRETILGQTWLVINPVLDGLAYFLIFGLILGGRDGIENFLGYLIIGVFLFSFTTRCATGAAKSIETGRNLMRAFTFPKVSLPISAVLRATLNFVPTLGAMLVLVLVLPPREHLSSAVVLLPFILLLQLAFVTGLSMLLARVATALPDINQLIRVGTRFWLYGSAVFFSIDRFAAYPTILAIMKANPMYMVLDATRDVLLYGSIPTWQTWTGLSLWAFGMLIAGFLIFWQAEESYGRV